MRKLNFLDFLSIFDKFAFNEPTLCQTKFRGFFRRSMALMIILFPDSYCPFIRTLNSKITGITRYSGFMKDLLASFTMTNIYTVNVYLIEVSNELRAEL